MQGIEKSAQVWGFEIPGDIKKKLQESEDDDFWYFPENLDSINLHSAVGDQVICGPAGPIALNMATVLQWVQPLHNGEILCPVDNVREALAGLKIISSRIFEIIAERGKNGANP